MKPLAPALALALLAAPATATPCSGGPERPQADWRDQVVYFLMLDRFDDGDPSNNDQGGGEYDPANGAKYSGGDFAGACRRLDYIAGLGATAVWITPPVANQWWTGYGGYHGYWASDFKAVDPHLGTLADYRAFADALHARGLSLVQDVVVNHTGNFFTYRDRHDPADPRVGWRAVVPSVPVAAPTQWPFSLNDPRRDADRAAAIYHWTPPIADFGDETQERTYALADLDDLNTENPVVRRALRESYGFWIREVGVDAFRVDTAYHVPPGYFRDFLYSGDARAPGMFAVAEAAGRPGFHAFGEGFGTDGPYEDDAARKLETYVRDADGPLLPAMINFPLYGSFGDVFARSRPTRELAHRIESMLRVHADPHRMPTFVDNHDVDRFLAGGTEAGLRQALLAMLTLPGIPVVYYGTEQGVRGQRDALFAGGVGSGGRDRFDTSAPLYRYLADAIALRRGDALYSRGVPTVLRAESGGAGVIAWRIDHDDAQALVVFNTAEEERLLDRLETGLAPGTTLRPAFSANDAGAGPASVDGDGRVSLRLPARAGFVFRPGPVAGPPTAAETAVALSIDPLAAAPVARSLAVSGRAAGVSSLALLVDGRIDGARAVDVAADGTWAAELDTNGLVDPAAVHRVVAWHAASGAVSDAVEFRVAPAWRDVADVVDPADDDHGREGGLAYPLDRGWRDHRPADIRRVRARVAGGSLRLVLTMADVVHAWNAPNGFDHVLFTVFIGLPGRDGGARVMPLQQGELPDRLRWHGRFRVGGWSSAAFTAAGASADDEGRVATPAPSVAVDRVADTVTLTLPAGALGYPPTLDGATVVINTWDYDGGYRVLQPEAGRHQFGGAPGSPLVMDEVRINLLRAN